MAKKLNDVWDKIASWENLTLAHRLARRGKRRSPEVARFDLNWETEIAALERELVEMRWTPGEFRQFTIYEAKPRLISAVPYCDRVVHQAIMNVLGPHFERSFIFDTYACRVGKGTEAARARAQRFMRARRFVLHLDFKRYFPSIPHGPLKAQLRRRVGDARLLEILNRIVDENGEPWPDDLIDLAERRGLPIGSLTSQWFANLYLSSLDHWIKERLGVTGYVRYMDDLVLFDDSRVALWRAEAAIREYANERLWLTLHDSPRLAPCAEGLSFLGMRLFPEHRRLLSPSGYRFRRRLRGVLRALDARNVTRERASGQVAGWLGHARLANTVALRAAIRDDAHGRRPGARTA